MTVIKNYKYHCEESKFIPADAAKVFAFIDDHKNLSSHMDKPTWTMGGGRIDTSIDAGRGQEIGSRIRMSGKAFGIRVFLDEVVTRREPPRLKIWETVGTPKLLVVGDYRIKVEVDSQGSGSVLRVSIDYNLPPTNIWLGKLFGGYYAKWCVQQVIKDTYKNFK